MEEEIKQEDHELWHNVHSEIMDLEKTDGKPSWSPSSLKTFSACRLKYFFKYIKGWKINENNINLALGSSFHASMEKMNRELALGNSIEKTDIFEEFDTSWDKESSVLLDEENKLHKTRQIGLDLVERVWNSNIRKAQTPSLCLPKMSSEFQPAVEFHFDVPFIDVGTGRNINDRYKIKGFADVICEGVKDTSYFQSEDLMVLDYKTASRLWEQFTVDTDLQLLMYAYCIRYILRNENFFPHIRKSKEDKVGIICLHKKKISKRNEPDRFGVLKYYLIQVSDEEIDFLENMLANAISEIETGGYDHSKYIPNPSAQNCNYCEYKEPCLAIRRGAGEDHLKEWEKNNKNNIEIRKLWGDENNESG